MALGGLLGTPRRRLATAHGIYRSGGLRAVVRELLPLFGYHRVILFEATLNPPLPVPPARVPLEFGFVGTNEIDELLAFRSTPTRAELERRFERDERCFAARHEGRIVCTYWVHRHTVRLSSIGYELLVPDDAIYSADAFTAPDMRGMRIAPSLSRELKNRLAAEGLERWVAYVLGGNVVGLSNAARAGSYETARIAAFKLGPLPAIRVPYLPSAKQRP